MRLLSPLEDLLDLQDGVIARKQALDLPGESDATIRRRLRRREWVTQHPGVYLNHTGEPTWKQRAWAAVLYAAPAALAGASALRAADGPGRRTHADDGPIEIAVDLTRDVREQPGIRIRRRTNLAGIAQTNLSPPRVRTEHAAIDAAAAAPTDLAAIGILSDVVRARRTTPKRLLAVAKSRTRLRRRHLLQSVLADAASGASSVLEMEFLRRVVRPHGLPAGDRQRRVETGGAVRPSSAHVVYRDVDHPELKQIIELDGRIGHSSTSERDADFERDLDAAVDGRDTLRLGWGQAYIWPCSTAAKLFLVLQRLGWNGEFQRCPRCPADLVIPTDVAEREDLSPACDEKSSA
jgi:hypothetical protein